jgi:outer membrane immunogenic protein
MKSRFALAVASALLAGSSVAIAADMPLKAPPPPVPVCVWCGFYIGGYAGYGWGRSDTLGTLDPLSPFGNAPPVAQPAYNANMSPGLRPTGFTGGGTAGYNWQKGQFVFGIEGDFGAFDLRETVSTTVTPPGHVNLVSLTNVHTDWVGTIRGRVGVATPSSMALFYVTGGAAFTNLNFSQVNTYAIGLPGSVENFAVSNTRTGWTAGAGIEYMFAKNVSAKVEYLHFDFGTISGVGVVPIQAVNVAHSANFTADTVRVGVNWKLGAGPIVAKY